jgi:hypothetical protein
MSTPNDPAVTAPPPNDPPELKRWTPQPDAVETKTFDDPAAKKPSDKDDAPAHTDGEEHAPHAKTADTPLDPAKKHDHLADNHAKDKVPEKERQDALIDEGLEETFPASDPVSVKHIS